jgi:hypothetical protein
MMKKTAIALGIASMAFGAQAAEWMVTPDHKFEANVDVGACYSNTKGSTGQVTTTLYGCSNNQLQLRSIKTLDNGVKIIGQFEIDGDPVLDNSTMKSDDMRVGVDVPVWGKLVVGQFDHFMEDNVAEALGFWGMGGSAYVDEPLMFVKGSEVKGSVKSKAVEYYNKYENFELALSLNAGYADTTLVNPMYGLATTVGYKLGNLQMYLGSVTLPAYYSSTETATSGAITYYRTGLYTNGSGFTANYTMGDTKVAGLIYTVQTLAGAMYNMGGFSVEQKVDDWKLGFAMQNVNYGGTDQYTQFAVGANYTFVKNARAYIEASSLGASSGANDVLEIGMKYTF